MKKQQTDKPKPRPLTQACCRPAMKDARNHSKDCHWYEVERFLRSRGKL